MRLWSRLLNLLVTPMMLPVLLVILLGIEWMNPGTARTALTLRRLNRSRLSRNQRRLLKKTAMG